MTAIKDNKQPSRMLIVTAMDEEFQEIYDKVFQLNFLGDEITITKSGIGKVNAAVSTYNGIKEYFPDVVISYGYAGGLYANDLLKYVCPKRVVYSDVWCGDEYPIGQIQGEPAQYVCADMPDLTDKICKYLGSECKYGGTLATADRFCTDPEQIKHVAIDIRYADMEAAAVAQVCNRLEIPFIAIKKITDIIGEDGQMNIYENNKYKKWE